MGEQWTDRDDYDARCERIEAAQRELAPAREYSGRTPQQRRADARGSQPFLTDGELALARIAKLEALIADWATHITMLHGLIEQQQTGARHLAGRIDRLEVRLQKHSGQHVGLSKAISLALTATQNDLDKFKIRVIEAVPSVGKEESGE